MVRRQVQQQLQRAVADVTDPRILLCLLRGYGRAGTQNDRLSEAVILSTGTPTPAQRTCRRRCRDAYNSGGYRSGDQRGTVPQAREQAHARSASTLAEDTYLCQVRAHAYARVYTHVCMRGDTRVRTHVYTHTYTHAHTHDCTYAYMHAYTHAYVHAYTHAYVHAYTHGLCACLHAWPMCLPICIPMRVSIPAAARAPSDSSDSAPSRHRRRHACCAGMGVPVLKITASARRSF